MLRLILCFTFLMSFFQFNYAQIVSKELVKQIIEDSKDVSDYVKNSKMSISEVIKELKASKVDLNSDGNPEYIVFGLICGQNCSHWIYQKDGSKFIQIPFEGWSSYLSLDLLKTKTKGYRDLLGTIFLNCCEEGLETYKFNGFKYVISKCLVKTYGYTDTRGKYQTYKKPKIKQCSK